MALKLDSRQTRQRTKLDQLSTTTDLRLDAIMNLINDELTMPLRMRANLGSGVDGSPDQRLYIDGISVKTLDSGAADSGHERSRTIPPIGGVLPNYSGSGYIEFNATTGAATASGLTLAGSYSLPSMTNGQFVKVLVWLSATSASVFTFGMEIGVPAASVDAAVLPVPPSGAFALGYIVMTKGATTYSKVLNENIFQFVGGGGGSGSDSGEINLVDNSSDAGDWGVVNATATTNITATNNPLAGTIDSSIAIASSTLNGYARYRFSMPSALKQRKLKLEWYQIASSLTSGAYKVEVWTNSDVTGNYNPANYTELPLSTDSSGTSSIPNLNGKYSTTFDTNGSDYYEIRIVRTAASAATIYIANVVCGPGIQPQGAVVGEWQKYADADVALYGSTTNPTVSYTRKDGYYRRVGDSLEIQLNYLVSAWSSGSGSLYVGLPAGLTIDGTKLKASGNSDGTVGTASWYDSSAGVVILCSARVNTFSSVNRITLWANNTGGELQISQFGTDQLSVKCTVPIAEWAGSGTVQLAQNDVEYAWNSDETNATNTSAFSYGPSGVTFPNITTNAAATKRVRFQTPIQSTDVLVLEYFDPTSSTSQWQPLAQRMPYIAQGAFSYGITLSPVSSTDVNINFQGGGATTTNTTYAQNGQLFSDYRTAGWKWRLKKMSAGAAVGFGIVSPGVSAGLVSASGLPGNTTGNAIASGYVGQSTETSFGSPTLVQAAASNAPFNIGFVDIPQGVWRVDGYVFFSVGTAAGNVGAIGALNTNSADVGSQYSLGPTASGSINLGLPLYSIYLNVATTQRVYLVGQYGYTSIGTSGMRGSIRYTRIA